MVLSSLEPLKGHLEPLFRARSGRVARGQGVLFGCLERAVEELTRENGRKVYELSHEALVHMMFARAPSEFEATVKSIESHPHPSNVHYRSLPSTIINPH